MRLGAASGITGDFATGMCAARRTRAITGDFATGMRTASIPFIVDDLGVEENVQLAA